MSYNPDNDQSKSANLHRIRVRQEAEKKAAQDRIDARMIVPRAPFGGRKDTK